MCEKNLYCSNKIYRILLYNAEQKEGYFQGMSFICHNSCFFELLVQLMTGENLDSLSEMDCLQLLRNTVTLKFYPGFTDKKHGTASC